VRFRDLSKSVRRSIRDLAAVAHIRELDAELRCLDNLFSQWRNGQLGPHELNDAIHQFHDGPSRHLWRAYTDSDPSLAVASAIARGVLREQEIPAQAAEELRVMVARFSEQSPERDENES
jgi:hypothetical protein